MNNGRKSNYCCSSALRLQLNVWLSATFAQRTVSSGTCQLIAVYSCLKLTAFVVNAQQALLSKKQIYLFDDHELCFSGITPDPFTRPCIYILSSCGVNLPNTFNASQ